MRTNSSSSLASTYNIDEAVSPTSSTSAPGELNQEAWTKLKSYGKFFTTKLLQILIQSRSNDTHDQPCKGEKSPMTWFNINIEEIGEISAQVKRSLPRYPPETDAISIDFFLYTADTDTLPLESWTFHVDRSQKTKADGKSEMSELYHQLSTLLKSSMIASRMTPMHRYYVKKQSADTFVILYKIQSGPNAVNLGDDMRSNVIGCFPTPVGAFVLTLRYRTRMEIEQKLAQSVIELSPEVQTEESFQKVGSFSSPNTPDYDQMATSPQSIGVISHFSVSPPSANSPANPSFLRGIAQNRSTRSRTCSLASEPEDSHSASPKEKMHASQSMPVIPKNMPFANLLTISYTGQLGGLKSVPEEKEKTVEEDSPKSEEEEAGATNPVPKRAKSEPISDETIIPDLEHSQQTVVDDCMNDTMKPPTIEEKAESEDDDDSFVKIPGFGSCDNDDNQGLSELISTCKMPEKIESFGDDDIDSVLSQLDSFSSNQGSFDQFLSRVREIAERDGDA